MQSPLLKTKRQPWKRTKTHHPNPTEQAQPQTKEIRDDEPTCLPRTITGGLPLLHSSPSSPSPSLRPRYLPLPTPTASTMTASSMMTTAMTTTTMLPMFALALPLRLILEQTAHDGSPQRAQQAMSGTFPEIMTGHTSSHLAQESAFALRHRGRVGIVVRSIFIAGLREKLMRLAVGVVQLLWGRKTLL